MGEQFPGQSLTAKHVIHCCVYLDTSICGVNGFEPQKQYEHIVFYIIIYIYICMYVYVYV